MLGKVNRHLQGRVFSAWLTEARNNAPLRKNKIEMANAMAANKVGEYLDKYGFTLVPNFAINRCLSVFFRTREKP